MPWQAFRHIESRMPSEFYAHFSVRFARDSAMGEAELREMVGSHGFTIFNLNYRLSVRENFFEYRMVVRSRQEQSARTLTGALTGLANVIEFRLSPTGD